MENQQLFNEDSLAEEIKKTWGEYGAHYDVYKEVLKRAKKADVTDELVEALTLAREFIYSMSPVKNMYTMKDMDDNAKEGGTWWKIKTAIEKAKK